MLCSRIFGVALIAALAGCRDVPDAHGDASPPPAKASVPSAAPEPQGAGAVGFGVAERVGSSALVGRGSAKHLSKDCKINQPCPPLPPLPPCSSSLNPIDATDFADTLPSDTLPASEGQVIAIRGPLFLEPQMSTLRGCKRRPGEKGVPCCNSSGGPAVVVGKTSVVTLDGLGCSGDESRTCCNAPAFGQPVTAVGKLTRGWGSAWILREASLCSEVVQAR